MEEYWAAVAALTTGETLFAVEGCGPDQLIGAESPEEAAHIAAYEEWADAARAPGGEDVPAPVVVGLDAGADRATVARYEVRIGARYIGRVTVRTTEPPTE